MECVLFSLVWFHFRVAWGVVCGVVLCGVAKFGLVSFGVKTIVDVQKKRKKMELIQLPWGNRSKLSPGLSIAILYWHTRCHFFS